MQPEPSLTYISPQNKRVWNGKRRKLARRREVLRNIALQAGLPPLPRSRFTRILEVYASFVGVVGAPIAVIAIGLAIGWIVKKDYDMPQMCNNLTMIAMAVVFSLLQLWSRSFPQRVRDLVVYPPYVIRSYEQLIASGKVTICEVQAVEPFEGSNYLVHYQFTPLDSEDSVKGLYVTGRPIQVGMKMAVIYLHTTYNALL
jgi:hypothetical protein